MSINFCEQTPHFYYRCWRYIRQFKYDAYIELAVAADKML